MQRLLCCAPTESAIQQAAPNEPLWRSICRVCALSFRCMETGARRREFGPLCATRRSLRKRRIQHRFKFKRVTQEIEYAYDGNIGLRHGVVNEPLLVCPRCAYLLELRQCRMHLRTAAMQPGFMAFFGRSEDSLVDLQHTFFRRSGCNRHQTLRTAARYPRPWQQSAFGPGEFVQIIENDCRFDQRVTVIGAQGGHPAEWVVLTNPLEVLAHRPVGMLERQAENFHADGDAAHEG